MLVYNYSPTPQSWEFEGLYERSARVGMVHSAMMCGEHYDMAGSFSDELAVDAVTWSCGGQETYQFRGNKKLSINPAGILTLAAGDRYAYDASNEAPFRSNMISFPLWVSRNHHDPKTGWQERSGPSSLVTRFCRPSRQTLALMNAIAGRCAAGVNNTIWYTEHMVLLYSGLLREQTVDGVHNIPAVKAATRAELARRVERSTQLILEAYRDPDLSLDDMAKTACVSRFHFIRIFKDTLGLTPMQYLAATRMEAAMRLIQSCRKMTISEVADTVGYIDRAAFTRAFKRRYKIAPSIIKEHAF